MATAVEVINTEKQKAADISPVKTTRNRQTDDGSSILPSMEHFVALVRKVKRPFLVHKLLESIAEHVLPEVQVLTDNKDGVLLPASRNAVFKVVADLGQAAQSSVERAAERIALLADEYGAMAVAELLDTGKPEEAEILTSSVDRWSRALYLYLCQDFPSTSMKDDRFDHAEQRQQLLCQFQSDKYSSHYLGPKGAQPELGEVAKSILKQRLTELFPQIKEEDILVEYFSHCDVVDPNSPVVLYTLTAMFNGHHVHFQRVAHGTVEDIDSPAITNVRYSWHTRKGELSVFCDDDNVRPELAKIFCDVVLGGHGNIESMPIRKFDLMGFCTPAILSRFNKDRVEGIDAIDIKHLVVTKPEMRQMTQRNRTVARRVENPLVIKRDRFEDRNIYDMARQVHRIDDLTCYFVKQSKLTFRIAKTPHRKAHDVSVQVTAPNGFNDSRLTKVDSELVFAQLMQVECASQY